MKTHSFMNLHKTWCVTLHPHLKDPFNSAEFQLLWPSWAPRNWFCHSVLSQQDKLSHSQPLNRAISVQSAKTQLETPISHWAKQILESHHSAELYLGKEDHRNLLLNPPKPSGISFPMTSGVWPRVGVGKEAMSLD